LLLSGVWRKIDMYVVMYKDLNGRQFERSFDNLGPALDWAKTLCYFVTISGNGHDIVGMFGVDSVEEGVLPDGSIYNWKKRRE